MLVHLVGDGHYGTFVAFLHALLVLSKVDLGRGSVGDPDERILLLD